VSPALRVALLACGAITAVVALWLAVPRETEERFADAPGAGAAAGEGALQTAGARAQQELNMAIDAAPSAAVEAALALADAAERHAALGEAFPEFLSQHPALAQQWLRSAMPTISTENRLVLLRELAAVDPQLAIDLARDGNEATRRAASREVQVAWAAIDPTASAQAFLNDPVADDDSAVEISRLWAQRDPAAAFAFAASLDSTAARHESLAAIVEAWAVSDPASAAQALATLPPTTSRMPLVDRVARQWASSDPNAALAWAQRLPLAEERFAATVTVAAVARAR